MRVVVVGAGVGGLTAAAVLARAGAEVTVLEAHIYPGGCAGTFFHRGYRFDAGATLAGGFYAGGPMDLAARAAGIAAWPAHPTEPSMDVLLPDGPRGQQGARVIRYGDERRHAEHRRAFGTAGEAFFAWQERTADDLWELALRLPEWPPQGVGGAVRLAGTGLGWLGRDLRRANPRLAADALRPAAAHLRGAPEALRLFVDGQLLIAAQATSVRANALYGASALDLPRRGVVHLEGGMGAIAATLAGAVRAAGGRVLTRHAATRIVVERGRPVAVETKRGGPFPTDTVIANLPPWNVAALLGEDAPRTLRAVGPLPADGWGAFTCYVGLDGAGLEEHAPLHHQVIVREPLGEGNSAFLSLSPAWDAGRAPPGQRALTISTHTALSPWWELQRCDAAGYERRREEYTRRLLEAAERAIPGLRERAKLVLPGTPVTFARFTRRERGWVGGFPQTSLFRTWGPRLGEGLWLAGDSIFPGQSTAAVALGGLRVARGVMRD